MINNVIAGVQLRTLRVAGAPVAGTDEVQTLQHSGTVSGGTFKLYFPGINSVPGGETAALAYNANAATVQAALEAVVGAGNLICLGTLSGGMIVTGAAKLAKLALPALQLRENLLTGTTPSITVTETTPGVNATGKGAAKGTKLVDTTNGIDYINTGTANEPTWTKVGTQS